MNYFNHKVFSIFEKLNYIQINDIKTLNDDIIIEKAKELGCEVFDFEGSMLKGVERFFRSFGPELKPFYTINKAWKPIEVLLKFKKPHIF